MLASDRILEVVDLAYSAALEPQLWSDVLERFSDLVNGDGAAITYQNHVTGRGQGVTARLDPECTSLYFGHFAKRNPIQQRNDFAAMRAGRWRPRVIHDEHQLPKDELIRSEYYNDFMCRFGMHSCLMVGLAHRDSNVGVLTVMRPKPRGQFEERDFSLTAKLHPHLIRAFDLGLRLSDTRQLNGGLEDALDRSRVAVFVLDHDCALRHSNSAGENLLRSDRGLALKSRTLGVHEPASDRRLKALIASAAHPDPELRRGGAVQIVRETGRDLSVIVAPVRSERISLYGTGPSVLVLACDPDDRAAAPETRLKELFGFTNAEAGVAIRIMCGDDAKAIADALRLSIHTVRMHIARIMAKTETGRQAELVSLLLRSTMAAGENRTDTV